MMIVIDEPYISDFLLKSIQENNFPVISTKKAGGMIGDKPVNWISEEEARVRLKNNPHSKVYTNSENSIGWLENNADFSQLPKQIRVFKNKVEFRELLADSYPGFYFREVRFEELRKLDIGELKFPLMIKPAVGFFSIAVYRIENDGEWDHVLDCIDAELKKWSGTYPKEVINTREFIIEECIEGEEYAIDCYFNEQGKPVIMNILHHAFSSGNDVSDRVYSTSEHIITLHKEGIQNFLELIGEKINLVNFPAHVEVRIDSNGRINPIEVNPLRFGGWCTTGDLSWYAYGIDSYAYFFNSASPDWEDIFRTRKGKIYSVIVLDNNSGINEDEIDSFDYEQLWQDFEKPLDLRKVDFRTYSVFGFLFTETRDGNEKELTQILTSDLTKYIKLKKVI